MLEFVFIVVVNVFENETVKLKSVNG